MASTNELGSSGGNSTETGGFSKEKRRKSRKNVDQNITITNVLNQENLGRLVNIHEQGFMLTGQKSAIEEDCLYQLKMQFEKPLKNRDYIDIGVECIWIKLSDDGQLWSGFVIIDIADNDREVIGELIANLG